MVLLCIKAVTYVCSLLDADGGLRWLVIFVSQTDNGMIVIDADDVEFNLNGGSQTFLGLKQELEALASSTNDALDDAANAREQLSVDLSDELNTVRGDLSELQRQVNENVTSQLNALRTNLSTRIEGVEAELEVVANQVHIPVFNGNPRALACNSSTLGVVTHVVSDSCSGTYVCQGSGLVTLAAPGAVGSSMCNPAPTCGAAVSANSGAGTYYVGSVAEASATGCDANGLTHGDGSAANPALSCGDLFKHYPALRARGKRTYLIRQPKGAYNFIRTSFTRQCAREGQDCYCSRYGIHANETHHVAIRFGAARGSTHKWLYGLIGENAACRNDVLGDPWPGMGKICQCGYMTYAETKEVVCDPRLDRRLATSNLTGWWRAEDYNLVEGSGMWASINPRERFSHLSNARTLPTISNRWASVTNPRGWSRQNPDGQGAHFQYNGLCGHTSTENMASGHMFAPRTIGTQVNFGHIDRQYTLCTTSRYVPDPHNRYGRIFVADSGNWLHGHHDRIPGRVYYDGWVNWNPPTGVTRSDWTVTCTTYLGARALYVNNGVARTIRATNRYGNRNFGIGVGRWARFEISNYCFGEVLIWGRAFSTGELRNAALYLTDRLNNRG